MRVSFMRATFRKMSTGSERQSRQRMLPSRRPDCFWLWHHERSFLFFAARSDAVVSPPLTLVRFSESRMPWVGIGARFELSVRELTPIHEISEDNLPYSI